MAACQLALVGLLQACAAGDSHNGPPNCDITAPVGSPVFADSMSIDFMADVGDAESPADRLAVTWSSDRDGELGTSAPSSDGRVLFPYAELTAGNHVVTMTVADPRGAVCTDNLLVRIGSAPTIELVAPTSGEVVREGAVVRLAARVADGQDAPEELALSWASDLQGEFSTEGADSTGLAEISYSGLSRGPHRITVTVTDTTSMMAAAQVSISVNGAPSVPVLALAPSTPKTTDNLTVSLATPSTDPDGDPVTYRYQWVVDGTISSASTSAVLPAVATARGQQWSVRVTPIDGYGDGPAAEASAAPIVNSAPYISTGSITPNPATAADTLSCSYSFVDADGDSDHSTRRWTINGNSAGADATLTGGFGNGDQIACTVTPSDGIDTGPDTPLTMTIGNTTPQVSSVVLTPAAPRTNDVVTATVELMDPDDDPVTASYSWSVNLAPIAATGATLHGASWFDKGDSVQVRVTPNDGTDNGPAVISNAVTVGNTAPGAPGVAIAPASPGPGEAMQCVIYDPSEDADGDPISYAIAWSRDGVAYTGATSDYWPGDTVPTSVAATGDQWRCVATPSDGDADGAAGSAAATVGATNNLPEITSLVLAPTTLFTNDVVSVTATTVDADGDPVTVRYAWYVSGAPVSAIGSTLAGATWFDKHDTVHLVATPNDGIGDGTPVVSDPITVHNSPPAAAAVTIDPANPSEGDALQCRIAVSAVDADADSVTYTMQWSVDGSSYAGSTTTSWPGDTIAAGTTTAGQAWSCTATPSDGEASGPASDDNVTIGTPGCEVWADPVVSAGGDGSYGYPYRTIAEAIANRGDCNKIVLKPGLYREWLNFGGKRIHIRSEQGPEVTTIQPTSDITPVYLDSNETPASILEGVTVMARSGSDNHGIYIKDSSPTIRGCIISGNNSTLGGGVYATGFSGLFQNNRVVGNSATEGGGMYVTGGTPTIVDNWFEDNTSTSSSYGGGALFLRTDALVANNVFVDNGPETIFLATFGSSIDTSRIINNTIVDSRSYGIRIDYTAPASIVLNNVIAGSGEYDVFVGSSSPFDSVTWQNNATCTSWYQYSRHSQIGLNGNVYGSPRFVDVAGGDYHITSGSICEDTGQDVASYGVTLDRDGAARSQGAATDIGAYELTSSARRGR